MEVNKILCGDVLDKLRLIPDGSVNCCVTSPPYWGLRDYGVPGQIGLESTLDLYVVKMVEVFREVRRVLRADGTVWLNIGDTYATKIGTYGGDAKYKGLHGNKLHTATDHKQPFPAGIGLKHKDLVGIPWRVAFALQADGWYLRSDIIWSKPNPMPESVRDRPTRAHEYIFLLSKSARYYYDTDAIKEPMKYVGLKGQSETGYKDAKQFNGKHSSDKQRGHGRRPAGFNDRWDRMSKAEQQSRGANKRSVWHVATKPFPEAHFATFPPDLIRPCIKAGCPADGVVLDPFMGSGTTGLVARQEGRNFIGIELNPAYVELAMKRLRPWLSQKRITEVCN